MDIENQIKCFAGYVASRAPVSYDNARILFSICDMMEIGIEKVVEDLKSMNGNWYALHREYVFESKYEI